MCVSIQFASIQLGVQMRVSLERAQGDNASGQCKWLFRQAGRGEACLVRDREVGVCVVHGCMGLAEWSRGVRGGRVHGFGGGKTIVGMVRDGAQAHCHD